MLLKVVLALGEFWQSASFVSLNVVLTLGELGQLASFVPLKIVQAFVEFRQLASLESVYFSYALGELRQLADFWHSSVPCIKRILPVGELAHLRVLSIWRDLTVGKFLVQLRVMLHLARCRHLPRHLSLAGRTWQKFCYLAEFVALGRMSHFGGVRQMLLHAKCNVTVL